MAEYLGLTANDLLVHAMDVVGGSALASGQRELRTAVLSAYREVCEYRRWQYLLKHHRLNTQEPYSTGTVDFDLTGGATCENQLTLASGTWPSWAEYGSVKIDDVVYDVAKRHSSTVIELLSTTAPTADIAAGKTYTLFQSAYQLPSDFLSVDSLLHQNHWYFGTYVPPTDWLGLERYGGSSGNPQVWTLLGDTRTPGRMCLHAYPYPATAVSVDFIYHRLARPLKYLGTTSAEGAGSSGGTVTISSGAAAVQGNSTAFPSDIAGSIIRLTTSTTATPGGLTDPIVPYAEQKVIYKRSAASGASALTLNSVVGQAYTTTKYLISDPVDIDPVMTEALLRCIEKHVAIIKNKDYIPRTISLYEEALWKAADADSKVMQPRRVGDVNLANFQRLAYMPGTNLADP